MKTFLFFLLFPVMACATVTIYNNTDYILTVTDSTGAVLGTVANKTAGTVAAVGFSSDYYFSVSPAGGSFNLGESGSTYAFEAIDGATVSIDPRFVIRSTAPMSVWLDYFRLGFKVQIGFELFGFMIRLVGLLRKPTGAEL